MREDFAIRVTLSALKAASAALLVVACAAAESSSNAGSPPSAPAPVPSSPIASPTAGAANPASRETAKAPRSVRPPSDANVILITVDSLRADMPWTGYTRPIAPRMTELAAKAVVYTHAYATSSYTSMSLGGLLGGKYPSELKRDGFFFGTYAKDNVFFPELLKDHGVHTLGAHAHGYFKTAGFDQGFEQWDIVAKLKWNNKTDENVTSSELVEIAQKQLSRPELDAPNARFFDWIHFMDPHDQYQPHEGIGPYGKTLRDRYDAEVTYTDGFVGRLVDFVMSKPWGKRTIIIISSDHGEAFGEHGQYAHGFELWENLVRVPLLVIAPGATPRKVDVARSHVDLAKTILDVFGVEPAPGMRGASLVSEIYGAVEAPRDVFIDLPVTSDNDRRRAMVTTGSSGAGDKKVISFGMQGIKRVFDLARDPGEEHALSGDAITEPIEHFRVMEKSLVEVAPTVCKEDCVNGGYLKKDGGT